MGRDVGFTVESDNVERVVVFDLDCSLGRSERGNKHRGIKKNKVTISFLFFMREFKGWSI